jgi:hypothetical protein
MLSWANTRYVSLERDVIVSFFFYEEGSISHVLAREHDDDNARRVN